MINEIRGEGDSAETLYIVIPAYNEQENIEVVARDWHNIVKKINLESKLVIIDDGSKDNTYPILVKLSEELPQLIALTKTNGGHGATILFGYKYALKNEADFIFQTDSDGQTIAEEFWLFWAKRKDRDILIGERKSRADGLSRVFVTKVLRLVLLFVFHTAVPDANTPFRLMRQSVIKKYLPYISQNCFLTNVVLTVLFLKGKENVEFIPITFRQRQGGINSINIRKIIPIGIQALKDFQAINKRFGL